MESIAQFKGFLSRLKHREGTFLIIAAIAIGIVAGLSFLLFHWLINFLSLILVGEETGNAVAGFMRLPVWQQILLPWRVLQPEESLSASYQKRAAVQVSVYFSKR